MGNEMRTDLALEENERIRSDKKECHGIKVSEEYMEKEDIRIFFTDFNSMTFFFVMELKSVKNIWKKKISVSRRLLLKQKMPPAKWENRKGYILH